MPVLFILPEGPTIGGVTTWACSLAPALAERAHDVSILAHGHSPGHEHVRLRLPHTVHTHDRPELPTPRTLNGRLEPIINAYADITRDIHTRTGKPVLLLPTRDADCFAACAELARRMPDQARLVGWRHSPMPYEHHIFTRFGPAMSGMIGVSTWLRDELRRMHPQLKTRVGLVMNGVDVPASTPPRPPAAGRPLRLIYTGRLDEPVKRVSALLATSAALDTRAIAHQLSIVGDGPANESLAAQLATHPHVRLVGPQPPHAIAAMLREHDVFILPSRIEGLSLSALEAMAQGCALVLTRTRSGCADIIGQSEAGELIDINDDAPPANVGAALAAATARLLERGVHEVGKAAHARAARLFSIDSMADAASRELDLAAQAPPPALPDAPILAFHDPRQPASVPSDAAGRMEAMLQSLAGRRIIIHGCGQHTRALQQQIEAAPAHVVAFADDSPAVSRSFMDLPLISPPDAATVGATDVVISSWMHEPAIWARRSVYERQGLRVHRLYADAIRQRA